MLIRGVAVCCIKTALLKKIVIENGTATGVQTQDGFQGADVCILAAGCWSGQISGLPDTLIPPVRPVKGQMLALRMQEGVMLKNVIRTVKARYPDAGIFSAEIRW